MNADTIRDKFTEEFGRAKYVEFVLSLYSEFPLRSRLHFWQDQLLQRLSEKFSILKFEITEAYSIFNCCPIHNAGLKAENVPVVNGNNYKTYVSHIHEMELFPLANINAPRDLDNRQYPENVEVLYCPICRIEKRALEETVNNNHR